MSFLVVPSALIHASGFSRLSLSNFRLFWRLVGELGKGDSEAEGEVMLDFLVSDLVEPGDGEAGRARLEARFESLMEILLKANLDGRDGAEYWRVKLRFMSSVSMRDDQVKIAIPSQMVQAIRSRETFTKIKESVLFSMRGSKYSAILYTLIRDKLNQRVNRWQIDIEDFRTVMQTPEKSYPVFKDFRINVIEPAIKEVNELSEFDITWSKARTFKNQVRELAFEWKLKDLADARKVVKKQRKKSVEPENTPQIEENSSSIALKQAVSWLTNATFEERRYWAARAVQIGAPKGSTITAKEYIPKWAHWVARELLAAGLTSEK